MKKFTLKKSHWLFRLYRFWFDEYYFCYVDEVGRVKRPLPETLCSLVLQIVGVTLFAALIVAALLSLFILFLCVAWEAHPIIPIGMVTFIVLLILGAWAKDKYCPEIEYIDE